VRVGLVGTVIGATCAAQLTSNSGADTAFVNGTASATAQAVEVAPTTGGLSYAIILATSDAAYENAEGQALSQTLDLGAIGTALEADNCQTGGPGTVSASDFPAPIQAESTNGNQTLTKTAESSLNGIPAGGGVENASATQAPMGMATTTLASEDLANVVNISGASTNAVTDIVGGATRSATATSDIASISLADGLVDMKGLRWTATQTSGASTTATGTFSLGALTIAGVSIPIPSATELTSVIQIINTALSPTGLEMQLPTETTLADGTVQVSPLIVGIDESALGQEVIGANLSKIETVRNTLQQELLNINCNAATALLIGDIGTGILAGGGDLNIALGGASAVTSSAVESSPFSAVGSSTPFTSGIGSPIDTNSSSAFGSIGTPAIPGTTDTTGTTGTTTSGSGKTLALGPTVKSTSCTSIGPAGGGCSSSNLALPVGLIGLGLLAGLAAWDYVRQRRRSRLAGAGAGVS
jgi:hypothetical protein